MELAFSANRDVALAVVFLPTEPDHMQVFDFLIVLAHEFVAIDVRSVCTCANRWILTTGHILLHLTKYRVGPRIPQQVAVEVWCVQTAQWRCCEMLALKIHFVLSY